MDRSVARVIALVLPMTCVCADAHAQDADAWALRPDGVELQLGFGTPVGYLGLTYERVIVRWLSVGAGLGIGSGRSSSGSLQLAAGARFRPSPGRERAFYLGLDYSTGGYREAGLPLPLPSHGSDPDHTFVYSERAHWLNMTIGGEYHGTNGLAFRIYTGFAVMLNPGSRRCGTETRRVSCASTHELNEAFINIVGLSLGYAP